MSTTTSPRYAEDDPRESGELAGHVAVANGVTFTGGDDAMRVYAFAQAGRLGYTDPDAYADGFVRAYNGWA